MYTVVLLWLPHHGAQHEHSLSPSSHITADLRSQWRPSPQATSCLDTGLLSALPFQHSPPHDHGHSRAPYPISVLDFGRLCVQHRLPRDTLDHLVKQHPPCFTVLLSTSIKYNFSLCVFPPQECKLIKTLEQKKDTANVVSQ